MFSTGEPSTSLACLLYTREITLNLNYVYFYIRDKNTQNKAGKQKKQTSKEAWFEHFQNYFKVRSGPKYTNLIHGE